MSQDHAAAVLSALECFRTPNHPYLLGEPLPGRGQPVKAEAAQRWRVCASLEGLAPVRPNQDMQARPLGRSHNPNPICRLRLKSHSMPPSSRRTPLM